MTSSYGLNSFESSDYTTIFYQRIYSVKYRISAELRIYEKQIK